MAFLFLFFFLIRQNKDIALVNLANILHRAHFSADAAIVVHAALDYSDFFTSYYTLGNIYAVNIISFFNNCRKTILNLSGLIYNALVFYSAFCVTHITCLMFIFLFKYFHSVFAKSFYLHFEVNSREIFPQPHLN